MNKLKLIVFTILLLTIFSACGQPADETVLPTLAPVVEAPTATPVVEPTAVPQIDADSIDWPPQIIFSSPAPGESALLDGAITIRFDQPMDQASVEAAFDVSTADSGEKVSGTFSWPRPDTVLFTPENQLAHQQRYDVQIAKTAVSTNGLALPDDIFYELETVGFLQVSQVVPAPDSDDVLAESNITLFFNRPVVPLTTTDQQDSLPQPLQFSPELEGKGEWLSTSVYQFKPRTALAGATTYQVTVDPSLTDLTNSSLEQSFSWQFSTVAPTVLTISPEDEQTLVRADDPIQITFNMPMDQESTESAVQLSGGATGDFSYEWSEDGRILTMTPETALELGTTYQLTVGQSATAESGGIGLVETAVSQFETVPFPAVLSTNPSNGTQADRYQRGIVIRFASPMDIETLDGQIVISPEPEGRINTFFNDFSNELILDFTFQPSQRYSVTIPRTAADPYGNTLEESYGFVFTSPNQPPIASFNLPANVTQLSSSFVTTVDLIHVNISEANLALYDLGLPLGLLTRPWEIGEYRPAADPLRTWEIDVDGEENAAEIIGIQLSESGSLAPGIYLLTVDSPETRAEENLYWQNQREIVIVSDSNVVVKEMVDEVHVWVTELRSGESAAGLSLTMYDSQGIPVDTAVSDNNGFASFNHQSIENYLSGVTVVANQPGEVGFGVGSSQWQTGASSWEFGVFVDGSQEPPLFGYLYTDRPIYRPGDTVHFKGIVRETGYGRYALPDTQEITINLHFNGFFDGQAYTDRIDVEINADGTLNGNFELPDNVPTGAYFISIEEQNFYVNHNFTVAEYRRPEFLVEMVADSTEALRGESATVAVSAEYFFGGSAVDLPVTWMVTSQPFFFSPEGPFFNYGDTAGFNYFIGNRFLGFGGGFGNILLEGEGVTDSNGRLQITLPADLLDELDAGTQTVMIEATITDLSNVPVSSRTEFTFHSAETYVGIKTESPILRAGQEGTVALQTVDWDGTAVGNQSVEVVFYEREWRATREQDIGGYYTSWEPIDTEVASQSLTTDASGEASASFTPEIGGSFIAVATVTDRTGRESFSSISFWVADDGRIGWQLDPAAKKLNIEVDQTEYNIGDTAQLLIQSPFTESVQAWLTIERGDLISQELITLDGSSEVLSLPIPIEYAPNVFVTVTAVKPFNPNDSTNPQAEIRLGIAELVVNPEPFLLDVSITPQEPNLEPRDTAVFDILVTDSQGNPVATDLSLALVDKAILTLKEDSAEPIGEVFYRRQPLRSQTGSGLFISGENLTPEVPLEILGFGGGGGGGVAADEAVALRSDESGETDDDDARADFPDTAYWQANISTDGSGRATVSIDLPDTLTTWVLLSKAASPNTLVGQGEAEIVTSLPLLVRPVTPRFFTVGDVLQIGAIVNNNTGEVLETAVSLQATGITLQSDAVQIITIPANGQQLVQWQVTVPDGTSADLTFRAESGDLVDVTKPSFGIGPNNEIPIYRYTAQDIVGTAGVMSDAGRQVEAIWFPEDVDTAQGQLTVQLESSLVGTLSAVVNDLSEEPSRNNCPASLADAILPRVVAAQISEQSGSEPVAGVAETDDLIAQLVRLQNNDGGWGWCGGTNSQPYFTAQIVVTLWQADQAGFRVDSAVLIDAVSYLRSETAPPEGMSDPVEINQQLFSLYAQSLIQPVNTELLVNHYDRHLEMMLPESRALMALMLDNADALPELEQSLVASLEGTAVLSATGAHWEAPSDWTGVQTDVRNTAVVLSILSQINPESELLVPAVRWLMSARQAIVWETPHDTAWTTLALFEWATATNDINANYDYRVLLDLVPELESTMSAETAEDSTELIYPLSDLAAGEAHFVEFQREPGTGNLYYTLYLDSALDASRVTAVNRGMQIVRTYYDADCDPAEETCQPISQIEAGQQVRVELTITVENDMLYAIIDDPIPAGAEAIDPNLDTSSTAFGASGAQPAQYERGYWGYWVFNQIEFRDEKVTFMSQFLPAGTYQYTYFLQATLPGEYQVMPTFGRQQYMPEVNGRSDGMLFEIVE